MTLVTCICIFISTVAATAPKVQHQLQAVERQSIEPILDRPHTRSSNENETQGITGQIKDKMKHEAAETLKRLRGADIRSRFRHDLKRFRDRFLPHYELDLQHLLLTLVLVSIAVAWFVYYFVKLYGHDREASNMCSWEDMDKTFESSMDFNPDMVFVFHHPCHPYKDNYHKAPQGVRDHVLLQRTASCKHFHDFEGALDDHSCNLHKLRTTLLKDTHEFLIAKGFDVVMWSSVDRDEIFLSASLTQGKSIDHYLTVRDTELQIQPLIVAKLGINQPPADPESATPAIRFDLRTVQKLYANGIIEANDARLVFETEFGRTKDSEETVMVGAARIRAIYGQLAQHIDLDGARQWRVIVDWYPVHDPRWLDCLSKQWGKPSDFTFHQPLQLIEKYFGARLAFNFEWNGHYCKSLLALVPIAICAEIVSAFGVFLFSMDNVIKMMVLGMNIIIIGWSRIAHNRWSQEEGFFKVLWKHHAKNTLKFVRPSFRGEWRPSPADLNTQERDYPVQLVAFKQALTGAVTLFFCGVVGACIIGWYELFGGQMSVTASLLLTLQIKVFEALWNLIVPIITEWENHKYQDVYYNSYLWKLFSFQAVNSYAAFFYIAFKQKEHCPNGSCLEYLRTQLVIIQIILSMTRVLQIALAFVKVKFFIWLEDRELEKAKAAGNEIPMRHFVETQEKLVEHRLRAQIEDVCQLLLSLGFILLFGAVAPIMVPFSLGVFVLQLRVSAYLLIYFSRRMLPRSNSGMGSVVTITNGLMRLGVFFSGFLLVTYGTTFEEMPPVTKLGGVMCFWVMMFGFWEVLDFVLPSNSGSAELLATRRTRVVDEIGLCCQLNSAEQVKLLKKRSFSLNNSTDKSIMARALNDQDSDSEGWKNVPHLEKLLNDSRAQ